MHAQPFRLIPFDANTSCPVEITGTLIRDARALHVAFRISGAIEQVTFAPRNAAPARKNELWRNTCFELFAKRPDDTAYWEYNLAPSGDWNAYRFTHYRSPLQPEPQITDIQIETDIEHVRLTGVRAVLPLSPELIGHALTLGITSVIEDRTGAISYFALRHGTKPDFHDASCFTFIIDASVKPPLPLGEGRVRGS